MTKITLLLFGNLFLFLFSFAQVPGACGISKKNLLPMDGSTSLGQTYNNTACGLNYVYDSAHTETRYFGATGTLPGCGLPCSWKISGLPSCYVVEKAYVWMLCSYVEPSAPASSVTITNPSANTNSYAAPGPIGTDAPKCWGEIGSATYRWDVTSSISGNGTYTFNFSGFTATQPPYFNSPADQIDGATLFIIYRDPSATYQGTLDIWDGAMESISPLTQTMNGFTVCATPASARAFTISSDHQPNVAPTHSVTLNGATSNFPSIFYDEDASPVTLTSGQTSSNFGMEGGGSDCYLWGVMGLYYQTTTCATCTPSALSVSVTTTNAGCGNPNGTATAAIISGTAPFTYSWNPSGQTTQTATGLSNGTYTVTVTDANGCSSIINNITISNSPPVIFSFPSVTNVACFGNNTGSASVNVSSGTPSYTYSWNPSGQTTSTATGLSAGTYSIIVTDSMGCFLSNTITITSPTALSHSFSGITNINCFGNNNGSATINVSGGTPSYTYAWNPSGQTTSATTGLVAGVYTVVVTDAHGCTFSDTVHITSPAALSHSFSAVTNIDCFGNNTGSATVNVFGGTPSYTYSWSSSPIQTTQTATGLVAGTYTVGVTDSHGCFFADTITIATPLPLTHTFPSIINIDCFGNNNGSATVNVSGGTPSYTYLWSNSQTTQNATGLVAGTYSIIVTDAHGCTFSDNVTITTPPPLTHSFSSVTNVDCFGNNNGGASVNAAGGSPSYTYSWNSIPVQTSQTVTGLYAGVYTVTVTDSHGCSLADTVVIKSPTGLTTFSPIISNVLCFGGNTGIATITATGGTPGYNYFWNPTLQTTSTATGLTVGVYTVTITDNLGCIIKTLVPITQPPLLTAALSGQTNILCFGGNTGSATINISGGTPSYTYFWSPSLQTTSTATNLSSGTYTIAVSDANGCTVDTTITLTQPISPISFSISSVNVLCNPDSTGSIGTIVSGGTPGYSYLWMPNGQTTQSISNITAGTYSVTFTDANGCSADSNITITQPPLLTAIISSDTIICSGTIITDSIIASGGTPGYVYSWMPSGATTSSISISPPATTTYTAYVTDAHGCSAPQLTTTITVHPTPSPLFESSIDKCTHCIKLTDQSINAAAWQWNFGDNDTSSQQNPSHCYSGEGVFIISLTVNSSQQCKNTFSFSDSVFEYEVAPIIPNVFTPNSDGINDVFSISGLDKCSPYSLKIYDRWGAPIFETEKTGFVWDGRTSAGVPAMQGTYYYVLSNSTTTKTGFVELLR